MMQHAAPANRHGVRCSSANVLKPAAGYPDGGGTLKSKRGAGSKSGNLRTRKQTNEHTIKKLYGVRKMDHQAKHLEIMVEMQSATLPLRQDQRGERSRSNAIGVDKQQNSQQTSSASQQVTDKLIQEKAMVSPDMKRLLTQAAAVEERFQARMYATGGNKLIRRPDKNAFSKKHNKQPSQQNRDVYDPEEIQGGSSTQGKTPQFRLKHGLVGLYKQCCHKTLGKIQPALIFPLKYNSELALDMDSLQDNQEETMFEFVRLARELEIIKCWSSYTRLDDVDTIIKSQRLDFSEYIRSAVQQYFCKIDIESKIEPQAPQSVRSSRKLSIDAFENIKLMKSIGINLRYTRTLQELTLCGYRMTEKYAEKLNAAVLYNQSLKKLRINFCINKISIMQILLPCLTKSLNLEEINLAANALNDDYCYMINKIISSHQETKDEIIWQYGLRNERPPSSKLKSLKKLSLSHNQLTIKTVRVINRTIKSDSYCRALSLRANDLNQEAVTELYDALKDNRSMFNLDLRQNEGLTQKLHRLLALKMLSNYTKSGQIAQQEDPESWQDDQRFFNPKLLIVEIPTRMIKTYARKLESIRNICFNTDDLNTPNTVASMTLAPQNASKNRRSRSTKSQRMPSSDLNNNQHTYASMSIFNNQNMMVNTSGTMSSSTYMHSMSQQPQQYNHPQANNNQIMYAMATNQQNQKKQRTTASNPSTAKMPTKMLRVKPGSQAKKALALAEKHLQQHQLQVQQQQSINMAANAANYHTAPISDLQHQQQMQMQMMQANPNNGAFNGKDMIGSGLAQSAAYHFRDTTTSKKTKKMKGSNGPSSVGSFRETFSMKNGGSLATASGVQQQQQLYGGAQGQLINGNIMIHQQQQKKNKKYQQQKQQLPQHFQDIDDEDEGDDDQVDIRIVGDGHHQQNLLLQNNQNNNNQYNEFDEDDDGDLNDSDGLQIQNNQQTFGVGNNQNIVVPPGTLEAIMANAEANGQPLTIEQAQLLINANAQLFQQDQEDQFSDDGEEEQMEEEMEQELDDEDIIAMQQQSQQNHLHQQQQQQQQLEQIQEESYQNMTSMGSSPAVRSSAQKTSLLQSATVNSKQPHSTASEKNTMQQQQLQYNTANAAGCDTYGNGSQRDSINSQEQQDFTRKMKDQEITGGRQYSSEQTSKSLKNSRTVSPTSKHGLLAQSQQLLQGAIGGQPTQQHTTMTEGSGGEIITPKNNSKSKRQHQNYQQQHQINQIMSSSSKKNLLTTSGGAYALSSDSGGDRLNKGKRKKGGSKKRLQQSRSKGTNHETEQFSDDNNSGGYFVPSSNHGQELSDIGAIELRTDETSITGREAFSAHEENNANNNNLRTLGLTSQAASHQQPAPDFLKIEDQQRNSSIGPSKAGTSTSLEQLQKISPIVALQPKQQQIAIVASENECKSFASGAQKSQSSSAAGGNNCGHCMTLTKKLLNSEAERLEMTLQLAKQKLVMNSQGKASDSATGSNHRHQSSNKSGVAAKSQRTNSSSAAQNDILMQTMGNQKPREAVNAVNDNQNLLLQAASASAQPSNQELVQNLDSQIVSLRQLIHQINENQQNEATGAGCEEHSNQNNNQHSGAKPKAAHQQQQQIKKSSQKKLSKQ